MPAEAHAVRSRRPSRVFVRLFAVFATIVMVLTVFGILARPASAASVAPPNQSPVRALSGPGFSSVSSAGTTAVAFQETFQRWDGVFEPLSALNLTTDDWPYILRQDLSSFTITRLGSNFTQAKIPGAVYDFEPGAIKETIVLSGRSDAPFDAIGVGLRGSYLPLTHGAQVSLLDRDGNSVWESEPFTAHDSSPVPQQYANPVRSVAWSPGGLTLRLDPEMLTWAQYPLYLDPTWVIRGTTAGGWSGSLDAVTNDRGDANLRLGVLADNFNDNINEIWTVTSGKSFSLSGGRASLKATEVHAAGSWSNLTLGATLNFASCGAANLMFRYVNSSNYYYLYVNFASQQVTLYKVINGVTTALSSTLSIAMSANTNYDAKVVGRGNAFEIWWAGAKKWSGSDPSPPGSPLTGNVGLSETTSGCILYLDNVRARDPAKWSGNYTSVKRGAASGNVTSQVRFLGTADAYNVTDLWINSSSDNTTWGGWRLVKTMAAPGVSYPIPDVDQKRYYQVRAVLRTGADGTPSISEIDVTEAPPLNNVVPKTNTGYAPWYPFIAGEVNAVSGDLVLTSTDLSIPAKGGSLAIVRSYNSLLAATAGPFGLGTMDAYHEKLTLPGGGNVTWTAADGSTNVFVTMGGNAFSPPPGVHDNLVKNADGTFTLWQQDGSRVNFDATGRLTSTVDRNGNHVTLTYTGSNPTRVSDDSGLSLSLAYDASNRVTSVTDPISRKVQYTYNGTGVLIRVTDPLGFAENATYDQSNRLIFRQDRAGHVDRFVYDVSGRVSQMWVGEWNFTSSRLQWQVDVYIVAYPSGTQTSVTNALGGVTTIVLNSQGNPTSISGPSIGCALCSGGNSTGYTWDGEYDRLTRTDGRGDTTVYAYDWMGNTLSTRDPGGNTTLRTFLNVQNASQFLDLLTRTATPRGFTTSHAYYGNGNLYATTEPGPNVSYRFYDAAGSLTRLQDFRGNSVSYAYDNHEYLTSGADSGGNTTSYQNDGIGRTWNVTSPGGNVTRTVYDLDNRVISTTDPMGNTTNYVYDKDGRMTQITDANGHTTKTSYNITFGVVQRQTSAGGNVTRYGYDAMGDRLQTVDADSHTTSYAFDAYRRITSTTTPRNEVTKFVYDAAGNLAAKTEANGTVVRYAYDWSNRPVRTTFPGGSNERTAYDQNGNVVERKGFELDVFYKYDGLDRVFQTRQVFLDAALTVWHNYTYDQNGNRLSMDGPGGGRYTWDRNNRIFTETDVVGNQWTYSYWRDGQVRTETYPNGGHTTYAYDRDGRMTSETSYQPGGAVAEAQSYVYDKVGNIVSRQDKVTYSVSVCSPSDCSTSTTSSLTVSGLSPSPQTGTVSVSASGTLFGGEPGIPDTGFVTWYYILNGTATSMGTKSYTLSGKLLHFSGTFSTSVQIKNGNVLAGQIVFTSNSGTSTETTSTLSASFLATTNPTTFSYDRESRLYHTVYPNGAMAQYAYDAVGNALTYTTTGGSTVTSSYNADNELTSSSNGWTYSYDANGNRIATTAGGFTTHYTYDYANDLAPVSTTKTPATTSTTGKCSYSGCSTNVTIPALLPPSQTDSIAIAGSVSETDQIDSYPNCPTRTVTWYYVFDGVATQLGSQTLSLNHVRGCYAVFSGSWSVPRTLQKNDTIYEGINFLNDTSDPATYGVSVSVTVSVPPYLAIQYGPDGLRSSETVNRGSTTMHYGYDLLGMGGLPEEVADYNGTAMTTSYFYGVGSDRPLDLIQGGVSYLYRRDLVGSTTTLTDASGNVAASYRYDAYGNLLSGSGDTVGNPLRYTGLASDSTSGLTYARARWYDPATGAYLTPDPLGGGYAYAGDNPVNFVDPTGMVGVPYHHAHYPWGSSSGDAYGGTTFQIPGRGRSGGGGGGGGESGGGPPPETTGQYIDRCGFSDTVFVIGLALSIAGFWFLAPNLGDIADRITGTAWSFDILSIVTDFKDIMSWAGMLFDFLWFVFTSFLLTMFPWWEQVGETVMLTADLTLPVFVLNLIGAVTSGLIGYEGLVSQNCAPQL